MPSLASKKWILMNPGPVNVTARVRKSLLGTDLCHREPEFSSLLQQIRFKLLKIFGILKTHDAAILTGSGTLAVEAMLSSYGNSGRKILVLSSGVYGERLAEILRVHQIPHKILQSAIGSFPSIKAIETCLQNDKKIRAVAMVHHETSSGMLNPLETVGRLVKKRGLVFLVDAVSSLGAEKIDFKNWGIDFLAGSAGKCLHAYPGVSFVLVSKKKSRFIAKGNSSVYMDLTRALGSSDPAFTPAVQLYYAFNAALEELIQEGLTRRIQNYAAKSAVIQEGLAGAGARLLAPQESRSHVLTAAWLPPSLPYRTLHERLKKEGFIIYAGQSSLKGRIFRVSNLGDLSFSDLKLFLSIFKKITGRYFMPKPSAIVLAAGVGKRLGALTRKTPKCLVPLTKNGHCLLRRYFEIFKAAGIREVALVVGYQKEKIIAAAGRWAGNLKVRFIKNPKFRRGSILSLCLASSELNRPVLIMDADVFFPLEALERLIHSEPRNAFLIDPLSKSSGEEMMLMSKNGKPWAISKTPDPSLGILGEATGIVKLDTQAAGFLRKILAGYCRRDDLDREYEDAYCRLLQKKKIGAVSMEGFFWSEIDFKKDLEKVSLRGF